LLLRSVDGRAAECFAVNQTISTLRDALARRDVISVRQLLRLLVRMLNQQAAAGSAASATGQCLIDGAWWRVRDVRRRLRDQYLDIIEDLGNNTRYTGVTVRFCVFWIAFSSLTILIHVTVLCACSLLLKGIQTVELIEDILLGNNETSTSDIFNTVETIITDILTGLSNNPAPTTGGSVDPAVLNPADPSGTDTQTPVIDRIGGSVIRLLDRLLSAGNCSTLDRIATLLARYYDVRLANTIADEEAVQYLTAHMQVKGRRTGVNQPQTDRIAKAEATMSVSALKKAQAASTAVGTTADLYFLQFSSRFKKCQSGPSIVQPPGELPVVGISSPPPAWTSGDDTIVSMDPEDVIAGRRPF
jgi:hypothetical protein